MEIVVCVLVMCRGCACDGCEASRLLAVRGVSMKFDDQVLWGGGDSRAGSHLSSLALEASNSLLPPLGSHLDSSVLVGGGMLATTLDRAIEG